MLIPGIGVDVTPVIFHIDSTGFQNGALRFQASKRMPHGKAFQRIFSVLRYRRGVQL